jgi:hypothetical protein
MEFMNIVKDIPFAKRPEYIEKVKNEITKLEEDSKISKENRN